MTLLSSPHTVLHLGANVQKEELVKPPKYAPV